MHVVWWQLNALVRGWAPDVQCDGTSWAVAGVAGKEIGCRAVLMYVKGDWAEFSHSFGLSSWSSLYDPCPCCTSPLDSLNVCYPGFGCPEGMVFPPRAPQPYHDACDACERTVSIDSEIRRTQILSTLTFVEPTAKQMGGLL
eukprot:4154472-Pyramimonas_sp.AAC.1